MSLQQIGRYQLKQLLGKGGMASVYLAHDPYFERDVAVKILPREFLHDPVFRSRFEREAKTIAGMEHPAIVPVYDFGEEESQPFLVMRLMLGGSLADRIIQGPISLSETAWMIERIAGGFDAAHQAGIIHRDMKPSNILLDQRGNPYIADFGIVKLTETSAALTGTGMIGTPSYMAPEMGDLGGITHLVDIYALGVTTFQMLTGRLPFLADTPSGILVAHAVKPVPDPRELQADLPAGVFRFIQKAMAKNPAERYQSAGELASVLKALASGEMPFDQAVPTMTEPIKPVRIGEGQPSTMRVDFDSPATTGIKRKNNRLMPIMGLSGGVLGVAIAAFFLANMLPLGRTPAPTSDPPASDAPSQTEAGESTEAVADIMLTTPPTSTEVSLQPMISMLFGTPEVMSGSAPTFVSLQTSQPLRKGDTVRTTQESAALLTLSRTISIEVHPESQITLVDLADIGDGLTVIFQQTSGITYHVVTPSANEQPHNYVVTIPFATVRTTGTEFWVAEQENGWCAIAMKGSIRIDLGDEDSDPADDYLAAAEDESGWLVDDSNEPSPCTVDGLTLLIDWTVTPTPTATTIRTSGTTGETTGGASTGGTTTEGNTTASDTGGGSTDTTSGGGTTGGSSTSGGGDTGSGTTTGGGSTTGGSQPTPTAPPTNTPVPPTTTITPIPPTITPDCGICGEGGSGPGYGINCGNSINCGNKCDKVFDRYDACGNVCEVFFTGGCINP